jgi:nicotinamide-nucleotide amidase
LDQELFDLAVRAGRALKAHGLMLATAESCTGGWVGQCVTMVSGSSEWFERGFVTYTNVAKSEMLGVQPATLDAHGAVSEQTVREMVEGALVHSHARVALAVSGVAGPTGGTAQKPVGLVCIGWGLHGGERRSATFHFGGDRDAVRRQAVIAALNGLLELIHESRNPDAAGQGPGR